MNSKSWFSENNITKFIFLAPASILVALFMIYPAALGFYFSLTDWNGITKQIDLIGLRNFKEMFQDRVFYIALKNSFIYMVLVVFFQHIISLTLAVLIERGIKGRNFYSAILFIPCLLSTLVIGLVFSFILSPINGSLNIFLGFFGLKSQDWLGNPQIALYSIIATSIWQYIGYSMVIYMAGLQNVSHELVEAGDIDGTNAWQKFRYIEFPSIAPAFTINTVLSVIGSLKAFEIVYAMTGGGPGNATEIVATYVYNVGFTSSRMGYGTAVSLMLFVLIIIISFFQVKILRAREVEL